MDILQTRPLRGGGGSSEYMFNITHTLPKIGSFIAGDYARWALSPRKDSPKPQRIDIFSLSASHMWDAQQMLQQRHFRLWEDIAGAVIMFNDDFKYHVYLRRDIYGDIYSVLLRLSFTIEQAILYGAEAYHTEAYTLDEAANRLVLSNKNMFSYQDMVHYDQVGYAGADPELAKELQNFQAIEDQTIPPRTQQQQVLGAYVEARTVLERIMSGSGVYASAIGGQTNEEN